MLYGYSGRILRVDLSTGNFTTIDSTKYLPTYIGGTALSYRIVWEETNAGTNEWSPENPLIFSTGPVAGTGMLGSGRAQVTGYAPQGYPTCWAATSSFGGDFGPKMKFAGWDAIIVTGKSSTPVYLYVDETGGKLLAATDVWGMMNNQAQMTLLRKHGNDVAIATIGPAGENKVRWAAIETHTENGAGQGGFGAVMGDKKIKAVVIKPGTQRVQIADPDGLIKQINTINAEMSPAGQTTNTLFRDRGRYTTRVVSCPWSACTSSYNCGQTLYSGVPQKYTGDGLGSGVEFCAPGAPTNIMASITSEVQSEIRRLEGNLGLNHWETQLGMNYFVRNEFQMGKIKAIVGDLIPTNSSGSLLMTPEHVIKWWRAVASRQGEGDIWAEGTPRAAVAFGMGDEIWKTHKHGYGPHWDGRYQHFVRTPVWIVSALTWATHPRDAFDHCHDYPERYPPFVKDWGRTTSGWGTPALPYTQMCDLGRQLYGAYYPQGKYFNEGWDNPALQYTDKEFVTIIHEFRGMIKDSVPACDRYYPLLYDTASTPPKVGHFTAETDVFNCVVGTNWTQAQMHLAAERAFTLHRAIMLRQGRTRADDESVIPYFQYQKDNWPNETGPQTLDPVQFKALLDRYYVVMGWDNKGRPTRTKLESLGLKDVADALAVLGKLGT